MFGVFLIYTGAKIIRHRDDEGEQEATRGLGILRRVHAGLRRTRRTEVLHPDQRQARRDAAAGGAVRGRDHRRDLRRRLGAGDPGGVERAVPGVRLERLRDPRSAGDVLPARQRQGTLPLPVARARQHPDLRRRQDGDLALVPHEHLPLAGDHRDDAVRRDRVQLAPGEATRGAGCRTGARSRSAALTVPDAERRGGDRARVGSGGRLAS